MRRDSRIWAVGIVFLVGGLIALVCGQPGLALMLLLAPLVIRAFKPARRVQHTRRVRF